MKYYKLAEAEEKFAELIWKNEPIGSGDIVKLSEKEMNWKKSTTYTVLKKLCEKGSILSEIYKDFNNRLMVNSSHHQ